MPSAQGCRALTDPAHGIRVCGAAPIVGRLRLLADRESVGGQSESGNPAQPVASWRPWPARRPAPAMPGTPAPRRGIPEPGGGPSTLSRPWSPPPSVRPPHRGKGETHAGSGPLLLGALVLLLLVIGLHLLMVWGWTFPGDRWATGRRPTTQGRSCTRSSCSSVSWGHSFPPRRS